MIINTLFSFKKRKQNFLNNIKEYLHLLFVDIYF